MGTLYRNVDAIDAINNGGQVPTYIYDHEGNRAFKIKYQSTDGWRGYHYVEPTKKHGWSKVSDGWVTGDYDDAPSEAKSSNVEQSLEDFARKHDGDVMAVFVPTSNVFSTAYEVFIKS